MPLVNQLHVRGWSAHLCRMRVLLVETGLSAARISLGKRHQTVPADLEPPKGFWLVLGLG